MNRQSRIIAIGAALLGSAGAKAQVIETQLGVSPVLEVQRIASDSPLPRGVSDTPITPGTTSATITPPVSTTPATAAASGSFAAPAGPTPRWGSAR